MPKSSAPPTTFSGQGVGRLAPKIKDASSTDQGKLSQELNKLHIHDTWCYIPWCSEWENMNRLRRQTKLVQTSDERITIGSNLGWKNHHYSNNNTVSIHKVRRYDILSCSEVNSIKLDFIDYQGCIDNENHFQISFKLNSERCYVISYMLTINKVNIRNYFCVI
jgi:hypothetical protein